jgi:hypothetical protein
MEFPHIPEDKKNPHTYQKAEQLWAQADEALGKVIEHIKGLESKIYSEAGENSDTSVLFDFMKGYIMAAEQQAEVVGLGQLGHDSTLIMAASAITRLIRYDDRMRADTVLAQLDKEITDDDHH